MLAVGISKDKSLLAESKHNPLIMFELPFVQRIDAPVELLPHALKNTLKFKLSVPGEAQLTGRNLNLLV